MYNNDYSVYRNEKKTNSDTRIKMPLRGYHRKCLVAHYLLYNLLEYLRISSSLLCWFYFSLKGNVNPLKSAESICIPSAAGNISVFQSMHLCPEPLSCMDELLFFLLSHLLSCTQRNADYLLSIHYWLVISKHKPPCCPLVFWVHCENCLDQKACHRGFGA